MVTIVGRSHFSMLNIPLALMGGLVFTYFKSNNISIATLFGFIAVGGVAARNGIMMISHYLHLMSHEGEGFTQKMVIRGTLERFVPVMMTALSAGIGLIPLVLAADQPGKEILHPVAAIIITSLSFASAAEKIKAPHGGRIIHAVEPHAEFLISKDKKIEIRFVGEDGKVIAPAAQVVTVTMGDRTAPTKLEFTKDGDKLVSDKIIPEGENLPVVLQIKSTPDAKSVTKKFNLNMSNCPTCSHVEYACTCDHTEGGKEAKAH